MTGPVQPWKVLESKTLVSHRWIELREQRIGLPNGHELEQFYLITSPDWASALCVTSERRVVLVRQYRHGMGRPSLELPAGVIEPAEEPLAAAQRELLEETGYRAERWLPLSTVVTEPARHTTRAHFFCALGAVRVSAPKLDEADELEVVELDERELGRAVDNGEIEHGIHAGAILLAFRRGLIG